MFCEFYPITHEEYLKSLGITDINNIPDHIKEPTTNYLKDLIIEYPERFPTFIKQITEREDDTYHNKLDNISDFKNLDLILIERNRDGDTYKVVFQDQDNDLRSVVIYDEIIVGMHRYYLYHEDIKQELIDLINEYFQSIREGRDE